jgi:hypothetical protein
MIESRCCEQFLLRTVSFQPFVALADSHIWIHRLFSTASTVVSGGHGSRSVCCKIKGAMHISNYNEPAAQLIILRRGTCHL